MTCTSLTEMRNKSHELVNLHRFRNTFVHVCTYSNANTNIFSLWCVFYAYFSYASIYMVYSVTHFKLNTGLIRLCKSVGYFQSVFSLEQFSVAILNTRPCPQYFIPNKYLHRNNLSLYGITNFK